VRLWPNTSTDQSDFLVCHRVGYLRLDYSHVQWPRDRRGSSCEAANPHSQVAPVKLCMAISKFQPWIYWIMDYIGIRIINRIIEYPVNGHPDSKLSVLGIPENIILHHDWLNFAPSSRDGPAWRSQRQRRPICCLAAELLWLLAPRRALAVISDQQQWRNMSTCSVWESN